MAKIENKNENEKYYSYLEINTTKRTGLLGVTCVIFVFMTAAIMAHNIGKTEWTQLIIPIILMGLPLVLYPSVEKWIYQPWQVKAQKYERHYND